MGITNASRDIRTSNAVIDANVGASPVDTPNINVPVIPVTPNEPSNPRQTPAVTNVMTRMPIARMM